MLVHEHRHAEEDDRGHAPCESGLYASLENKKDAPLGCDSFFCDFQVNAEDCNLSKEIKSKKNVFFDGMSEPKRAFSYDEFKSKHLIKEFLPDYKLREFYAEEAKQNNQNTEVIEEIKKRATGNFISGYNYQANYYFNVINHSHYDNSKKAFSKEMLNYLLGNHFNNVSSEVIIKAID